MLFLSGLLELGHTRCEPFIHGGPLEVASDKWVELADLTHQRGHLQWSPDHPEKKL